MWFEALAPKSFLGRFSLKKGATFVGIFIFFISIICVLSLGIEIVYYKQCVDCTVLVMHNAYSFSINAIIYCSFMIFINVWFLWGVKHEKSSVVLSWVVITGLWWAQSLVLVVVLLCMYITESSLGWLVALACAILAFTYSQYKEKRWNEIPWQYVTPVLYIVIFAYLILVAYGFWLQIRKTSDTAVE